MSNAVTTLAAGDRVGEYQILARIGAGGMGVVYRALDIKLQRLVALKFLPDEVASDESRKQQFLREARIASQLDHPNIGIIHGISEAADGRTFIVMTYYEGETLARKLSHGPLAIRSAVEVAIQIARGLAAAHSRAVIHRDIKPGNIILTQNNVAKIVDFGLARANSNSASTQTMSNSGTIGYMSPEQTMGSLVDQRTDVWALGTVISEMCTGRNPFQRDSAAATILAILNEAPHLPDQLPIELRGILYHALAKDAAVRYQSANEMLADLEAFQGHLETKSATARGFIVNEDSLRESVEHASRPMWASAASRSRVKTALWMLGSAAALAVILFLLFLIPAVRDLTAGLFSRHEEHVAVLPFENVGSDPANEAVSQGLMDSLSSRLTNLEVGRQSLWVVPPSEIRRLKVSDPGTALRQLGATMVVKGSIGRDGQDVHLTVNLIDTKTLRQVGSAALEDRGGDLQSLQDEAVARLARLMHINVTAEMLRNTGGAVTPAAYEQYLRALGLLQRYDKPGNLDQAVGALESSVKTDPRFALGFAELGEAYRLKYVTEVNPKWVNEALANCQKAAQLDDRIPAVFVTLGRLHDSTGQYDLAIQEFQHALRLNARDPDALTGIAHAFEDAGRIQDAEANFKRAAALRSDSWISYNDLGLFYDRHNRYPESIAALQKAIELTPDNAQVYLNLGAVYTDTGDPKRAADAEKALKKSIELSPSYPAYANLGQLYYGQKRYAEAASMTEKALAINSNNYLVWNNLANAYEWLTEKDKAAAARTRAIELAERVVKLNAQDATAQAKLASLYARQNLREQATARVQTVVALASDDPGVLEDLAGAFENLGNRRQAIHYAALALQKGYPLAQLTNDHDLQSLIHDPNFRPQAR